MVIGKCDFENKKSQCAVIAILRAGRKKQKTENDYQNY